MMSRRLTLPVAAIAALCVAAPVNAAPGPSAVTVDAEKPATPLAVVPTVEVPISKGGYMVPKMVTLRQMTPAETEANAVWNMRAALNVAALQCQFSPFLNSVRMYNAILKNHSEELAKAQATMLAHFKRYDGAKAVNSFDQYTTRTYNSYSTLDAQYAFCEAAGRVGREVLAMPRGKMGAEAIRRNPEIREAMLERPLSPALALRAIEPVEVPQFLAP